MIILKILTFSYTLLSAGRPSKKTSAIRTYNGEEKIPRKKFHLQDTTKTSIKTMEIFSLLNTDLGNWNEWSLIKRMIVFFHVYHYLHLSKIYKRYWSEKTKRWISWSKQKHFFYNKDLAGLAKRALGLVSKNVLKLVIVDTRSWL